MIPEAPIGIIELGDQNIKCLIFHINNNDDAEILSTSITSSDGIHNDVIINLKKASNSIRTCISDAEKKAKISLKKINVIFEQPEFLCTKFSKNKKIDGSKIHKDDIEFLLNEAKKQLIHNDKSQSIIHIFNHNYIVDGKTFVEEPIDVYADSLIHEMSFITMPKNNLKNINQVFFDCDIEVERFISRTFSLGVQLLNDRELQFGSALIDLGYEKISLGLFKNLALVHSITFPLGYNHIIKDLSKVCSLDLNESKNIINNINFSFENNQNLFDEKGFLKNNYFVNSKYRKISKNLIINVIKARLDEICDSIKKQLVVPEFQLNSGINFLLIQEELNFLNLDKYFVNFFGPNINKINKNHDEKDSNNGFTSCFGALKILKNGWETEAIPEKSIRDIEKKGFFSKFFRIS
tara:strand:- start:131 stop:1354 length:1224 start_codon:yes stop_codon:yes gene_type:complete